MNSKVQLSYFIGITLFYIIFSYYEVQNNYSVKNIQVDENHVDISKTSNKRNTLKSYDEKFNKDNGNQSKFDNENSGNSKRSSSLNARINLNKSDRETNPTTILSKIKSDETFKTSDGSSRVKNRKDSISDKRDNNAKDTSRANSTKDSTSHNRANKSEYNSTVKSAKNFIFHKLDNKQKSKSSGKCSKILSLGGTRKHMRVFTKEVLVYLSKTKKKGGFVRREPYIILGERMPSMVTLRDRKGNSSSGGSGNSTTSINSSVINNSSNTSSSSTNSSSTNSSSSSNSTGDQEIIFNNVWRMDQVKGLLPHLPCRLKDYTSTDIHQCVTNRRLWEGKKTRLLFIGDSRTRQYIETFLDMFQDLDFKITAHEGDILNVDQFLGRDANMLWTKYKKKFSAQSTKFPDLIIEFYWTTNFGVESKNLPVLEPGTNPNLLKIFDRYHNDTGSVNETDASKSDLFMKNKRPNKNVHNGSEHPHGTKSELLTENSTETFTNWIPLTGKETNGENKSTNINEREIRKAALNANTLDQKEQMLIEQIENFNMPQGIHVKPFNSTPVEYLRELATLPQEEVPDYIFLGTAIWSLDNHFPLFRILDDISLTQMKRLAPVLRNLKNKTDVIWMMPLPFKDHMFTQGSKFMFNTNIYNRNLEWIANVQQNYLENEPVTLWDSFLPIVESSNNDCMAANTQDKQLGRHPRLKLLPSWRCGDRVHANFEAFVVAVQMILNYVCNEYIYSRGFCCQHDE